MRTLPLSFVFLAVFADIASAGSVPTEQAIAGTWRPRNFALARVSPYQEATLSLPFTARITELTVEPGVLVNSGEVLARFDAPQLRQHLTAWVQSRRQISMSRKRLNIMREGVKNHAIPQLVLAGEELAFADVQNKSRIAWEVLAADLDILSAPLEEEELAGRISTQGITAVARALGYLRAPFTGVVSARQATQGEQLAAGAPILELETLDRVYLDVGVSDQNLADWQHGESHWRFRAKRIALKLVEAAPRYDTTTGLWLLRFEAENPELTLRDGAWVSVEHLGAPLSVVWVPKNAVVARNGQTWCIVELDGSPKPVEVRVGMADDAGRIPVLAGLRPGAAVVTEHAYELLYRDLKALVEFKD